MEGVSIDRELTAEYHRRGWWSELALADHVARHAAGRGERDAFVGPQARISWRGYEQSANRLAAVLLELGIGRGDAVAVKLPDGAAVHAAFLACEKAGAVAVGIGARAGERETEHILSKTGALALVTYDEHRGRPVAETFARLRGELARLRHHIVVPRFELDADAAILVDGAEPAGTVREFPDRFGPDELWLVNSTSGTTGLPKCVMQAQNRWWYFHLCALDVGALDEHDIFMGAVPAPYGFGQWTSHFTPTYLGAPTVAMERFEPALALELIERERVTVLCAVSTQFRMLLNEPSIAERDLTSLRVMFTGGELIPYEPARRFEELTGARILNFYGSNESGLATATRLTDSPERRLRTGGRVLEGTELRLFEDGRDVTASGRGQPGTKGPAVCLGYLDDADANAQLFTPDGYLLHADIVELDADGYLTVVGRTSDIVIRGGKNISAAQVEHDVAAHPRVALAAAVPIPDEVFGERVCVFVQLRDGGEMELAELTRFLLDAGASTEHLPERLVVVERMPRSSGGKLAKGELRERAARLDSAG